MKKNLYFVSICFLFFCSFLLAGCARQQASETDMSLEDIAAAIRRSQQELPELIQITSENMDFNIWLSDYYLMQAEQVTDGVICYADGVEASEIAVLLLTDEKDCRAAEEVFNEYLQNRAGVFEGYAPQQAAMAKKGIYVAHGRYIALLICPEPQAAKAAFLNCFGEGAGNAESTSAAETEELTESAGEELPVPAGIQDSYNAEAVLQAYRSGDDTSLSEMNSSILEAAKAVIESEIDGDMSDYEKELAIHDYITGWSRFDYSIFGRSDSDGFADGSDTPYGVLINQSAMCHGYSSTFQLFMDMLDIECMTVFGTPGGNGVEHSWNMVKLDGEWYCVDCAWDDPIGGNPGHTYFNVTSNYLRRGSIHRWYEASVPEATGTAYAYGNH